MILDVFFFELYRISSTFVVMEYLSELAINSFIRLALAEDVGAGDHSSLACVPADSIGQAVLKCKDKGIIAGVNLAERIFLLVDEKLKITIHFRDGQAVKYGDIILHVEGRQQSILKAERLMLNCMQRMSGIATYTKSLSEMIAHTSTKLLDTRKTTPNFRIMEKWAVLIGGGKNHRFNLEDMIMLKDNHIDAAGGITKALEKTAEYIKQKELNIKVEVETRDIKEVKEVLSVGLVDIIMLDNFTIEKTKEALALINGKYETECSGGITEETIVAVAETGVDYISVGALTHSFQSLDLSLKIQK